MKKLYNQFQYEMIRNTYVNTVPIFLRRYFDKRLNIGFPNYYLNSDVIFIHIPKAAGSSVAHSLYGQSIAHMKASFYMKSNEKEYNSRLSFAISRDPWERAYSAYKFIKTGGTDLVGVEDFMKYKEFKTFESFIEEYLLPNGGNNLDHVLRPQKPYIVDSHGSVLVNHVGRLEKLPETESFLSDSLRRKITFPKINQSQPENSSKNPLNSRVVNMIGDFYKDDVDFFEYSR